MLFLTLSVLVANPKKLFYTVANHARGLLNREKRKNKNKSLEAYHPPPPPPPPTLFVRRKKKKKHATPLQALRRSRSVSRPDKDSFGSSTSSKGIASQNPTLLPCAI